MLILIILLLFKNYDPINQRYYSLKNEINFSKFLLFFKKDQNQNSQPNIKNENKLLTGDYYKIYKTSYYLWLENPIVGSGARSFNIECNKMSIKKNFTCSTHPHNIYFEVLVNQGLLGLTIFIVFITFLIINIIKTLSIKKNKNEKIIILILFTILISELWPLRAYGSIFQTVNGSIFWFILALVSANKYSFK
jgi:O-antigen ligase